MPARIRKGDTVIAISGKDKGKSGTVLQVRPGDDRAIVEGLNIIKRHTKPRPPAEPGGVIEKPAPIHLSNLALVDPETKKPTRVRIETVDGKRVRVAARSGKRID
ncbi:MAG: 50S ribosomal protein L24 [Thermoleophilia bacterium]|nr:50S ribosomal protein L24 [Thermoleophilia bacterium]